MCLGRPGGLYSRQVQSSQCNGFLHEGCPWTAPGAAPAGSGGPVGQRSALGFTLTSRAQQVPRAGLASSLLLAPALPVEAVSVRAGLLVPASGPPTFPGNQPMLSRPANLRHLSVTCACSSGQGSIPERKGSSIPQRPPCCPQVLAGGGRRRAQPQGQRVLLWAHQPPSGRWEPPGPTISISSMRHPPALSESV